jgi:hypothetical protein
MGEILNIRNLQSYTSARYHNDLPRWRVADMLHVKLPVLAYRDYVTTYDDKDWPFCWHSKRHVTAALRLTVTMLMSWQATRRRGGAKLILVRLEPRFHSMVQRLQKVLQRHSKAWLESDDGIVPHDKAHVELVRAMATAVGDIAELVKTKSKNPTLNPMLGSKVLSFFFPDFFPIWDTAWVSKALAAPLKNSKDHGPAVTMSEGLHSPAARSYARYLNLMIADAWDTSVTEYKQLERECIRLCIRDGYEGAKRVLDEFYALPVLFEACLLGRAGRKGEL